jgi:glycosyltransferase involved in cell wall biosynthesis
LTSEPTKRNNDSDLEAVDVVLITLNSGRMLEKCLESVFQNVPVKQIIVVDGGSTDSTLQILNQFNDLYHNVKIIKDNGNRATARQKGIENVTAEWFIFVDSDVVLCKNWYKKAMQHIASHIGAVWGIEVWSTIQNPAALKLFLWVTRGIFSLRGGTHDTLIRTQAVADIRIPKKLHVFEDAYIKNWIQKKNYSVIACYIPFCLHFRPKEVWTLQGSMNLIIEAMKCGNPLLFVKLMVAYGFYAVYSISQIMSTNRT